MWDLILRCGNQVLTAGLGSILGFDQAAFLRMAEELGYDRQSIAFLFPYVEGALIETIQNRHEQREQGRHGDQDCIDPSLREGR